MVIRIHTKDPNSAPMEFSVPVGADVEIHLYPGDTPTIEPHNERKNQHNVRPFDVHVKLNGDLMLDWVNVTQTANSTIERVIEQHVKKHKEGP